MMAWNVEVAARYKRIAEGEEGVILINRKSIQQLQEHFDSGAAKVAMSVRVEEVWEQSGHGYMDELNNTLRQNRSNQPSLPAVQEATPIQYQQAGPRPLGNPAILNPEVIAGSLRTAPPQVREHIPYNVLRPQQYRLNPLEGFQKYTWCITCGYRKSNHEAQERFGKPCKKSWCGKCYQRKEFHGDGKMGPYCSFPPHPTESQHRFWYG